MKNELSRIKLSDHARDYIFSQLKISNSLSRKLLKRLNNCELELFTFVSPEYNLENLYQFNQGGIATTRDSDALLIDLANEFLIKYQNGIVIFEDPIAVKNDLTISKPSFNEIFFHDEEVYYYAMNKDGLSEHMAKVLRWTLEYPFVCLFANGKNIIESKMEKINLDVKEVETIANSVIEFYVGAYDAESYIQVVINE